MPTAVLIERVGKKVRSDSAINSLESHLESLKSKEFELFKDIEKKRLAADTLSESIQLLEESLNSAGPSHRVNVGGWWIFGGTKMSSQEAKDHLSKMKGDRIMVHRQLSMLNSDMASLKSEISDLERTITNVKNRVKQ